MSILYETLWFYLEINAKDHYVLPSALRVMSTRSFLKWAGGKHRVARDLIEIIENDPPHGINWCVQDDESYHEPMLGSGSMYFQLIENKIIKNQKSVLGDINKSIICTMKVLSKKKNLSSLIDKLSDLQDKYPKDSPHPNPRNQDKDVRNRRMFYRKRRKLNRLIKRIDNLSPEDKIELSSLVIFLNKTCYNGLWRMNSRGEFNTPEGNYYRPSNICQPSVLKRCHELLRSCSIHVRDWKKGLKAAKPGDLVYLDPPYMPVKFGENTFTDYHTDGFDMDDQIDLAKEAAKAAKRGVRIIASNHDARGAPNIEQIYNSAADEVGINKPVIKQIKVSRTINCKGHGRVKVNEVLIFLYHEN